MLVKKQLFLIKCNLETRLVISVFATSHFVTYFCYRHNVRRFTREDFKYIVVQCLTIIKCIIFILLQH